MSAAQYGTNAQVARNVGYPILSLEFLSTIGNSRGLEERRNSVSEEGAKTMIGV